MLLPDSEAEQAAPSSPLPLGRTEMISVAVLQSNGSKLINFPFVASFASDITYAGLYSYLVSLLRRYLKKDPVPLSVMQDPESASSSMEAPGAGMEVDDSENGA
jgi:hypothetical protein